MTKSDLDHIFLKALGFFKSNKPGSDKLLYDLLAEHTKRPSKWLLAEESKASGVSETLVISEESSTSSDVSGDGRTSDAGAGTEIVELVSLDELPKKARHESLGDIVEDDDISQLMSETGVVMVTDEKSHVTMESEGVAAGRKGKRASSAVIYSDDEETDSCVETDSGDEFKGFSVGSSREETPDRSLSQLSVSPAVRLSGSWSDLRSVTPPGMRSRPPPLTKVEFNRSVSWDKSLSGKQSPLAREGPPILLHSPPPVTHPKAVYARPTLQSTPIPSYQSPSMQSTPRRFMQMKRQASLLTQNIKGPAKKSAP
ncbi:uncharacterized protein LOC134180863 [Corticium candelabrum]|uniref:uncharacterized protein LOC134180863 n=1 Tax=Corticium candelabrum TaxID=121492 RepID=UPI002E256213|nr:uncharacterized protein LOC134180863 [Corticium candelabrum]